MLQCSLLDAGLYAISIKYRILNNSEFLSIPLPQAGYIQGVYLPSLITHISVNVYYQVPMKHSKSGITLPIKQPIDPHS